jgi:hypothetical protein
MLELASSYDELARAFLGFKNPTIKVQELDE